MSIIKKFNEFCEKYKPSLWCLAAAIWFFADYFSIDSKPVTLLYSGFFWIVFAIVEFIKSSRKK